MTVKILHGDCLAVMPTLATASVDAVVTDPPYGLEFMGKEWDKFSDKPRRIVGSGGREAPFAHHAVKLDAQRGINFQAWCEAWATECLRVLKPGGHLLAFGGSRTYHRLACAIEDAGFEIRDQIQWLYGSGFPKSHDVSKAIDKRKDWTALPRLQSALHVARKKLGISQSEAARRMGLIGANEELGGGGFMWFETGMRMPTREQWPRLKASLNIGDDFDACFEEAEREITGTVEEWADRSNYAITSKDGFRRDRPATEAARQWEGWGTALKPAHEPIVMARKPLSEPTVAANVLKWGTGALNIDGCRIATDGRTARPPLSTNKHEGWQRPWNDDDAARAACEDRREQAHDKRDNIGRWPANVIHDGSEEVLAAFPESNVNSFRPNSSATPNAYFGNASYEVGGRGFDDIGSAARFFYTAKADKGDRLGSKHPTVKPVDLMAYLIRLITPNGGTVLDPFAGSGTTGMACLRENFDCILIEREAEYVADIERRIAHVSGADAPLFANP